MTTEAFPDSTHLSDTNKSNPVTLRKVGLECRCSRVETEPTSDKRIKNLRIKSHIVGHPNRRLKRKKVNRMTREHDKPETVRRVVVIFDISSSTTILEDLKRTDNLAIWRNFHITLKKFLQQRTDTMDMEMYKFMGDGWILLFPPNVNSDGLFGFLKELTSTVMFQLAMVNRFLAKNPQPIGLTFGIDTGELIRLEMNDQYEYLGRAINVAARLQGEAKRFGDKAFTNVALISKSSFYSL